jgi:hypothetical protein
MTKFKRCSVKLLTLGEKAISKGDLALHKVVTQSNRFHLYTCSDSYTCSVETNLYNEDKLAHIYIISEDKDEVINIGNWYYDTEDNKIGQLENRESPMSYDRKILATNDLAINLPRLPKGFIEKYIESFNENKPIEFAMVEYYIEYIDYPKDLGGNVIPKVDKSNHITIKRVKDNYTREEVVDLLKRSYDLGRQDYIVSQDNGASINTLYDWTNENL